MVSKPRRDAADAACEEWAIPMRELLGLTLPLLASGYIGSLRCTLAARRDLHHGSRSTKVVQHWPEFPFRGRAALVHAVYQRSPEPLQEILVAHYCVTTPRSKGLRADLMGLSTRQYWERVGRAKASVHGALALYETVRTVSASGGDTFGTVQTFP